MEAIRQPLSLVQQLTASGEDVPAHFAKLLSDPAFKSQIPILTDATAEAIPNQALIRYRGMVQDMPSPEYYVGEFQRSDGTWQSTKYRDEVGEGMPPHCETRIAERKPLLLVPVPGEVPWLRAQAEAAARLSLLGLLGGGSATSATATTKRSRMEEDVPDVATARMGEEAGVGSDTRMTEEEEEGGPVSTGKAAAAAAGAAAGPAAPCRARVEGPAPHAEPAGGAAAEQAQRQQAAGEELPPGSCMIYVYDDGSSGELKLNDVVEVVGILSRVPQLAAAHMTPVDELSLMMADVLSTHLPTSRVPRLHALAVSPQADPYPASDSGMVSDAENLPELRARVLGFLSMVLGGDDLAAEYLLLQLVSRVHIRNQESAVGVLPLNLTHCPTTAAAPAEAGKGAGAGAVSPLAASLALALEALSHRALALPLSIDGLNRRPWWPRRDQSSQRLLLSPLQLAPGTQLLLDETAMASGTLSAVGLRNLAALQHLMKAQKVAYDFEYFSLDQPADAPVTVLSHGRSLLREAPLTVLPLRPAAPLGDPVSVAGACASADLAPLRAYLAAARRLDVTIDQETGALLEKELASARQRRPSLLQEELHGWLNVARLVAASFGEPSVGPQRWEHAMALERRRRERLQAAGVSAA